MTSETISDTASDTASGTLTSLTSGRSSDTATHTLSHNESSSDTYVLCDSADIGSLLRTYNRAVRNLLHHYQTSTCDRCVIGLDGSSTYIPHPEKASTGGEDSYFISHAHNCMGVADGVGGWRKKNGNAKMYSGLLMIGAETALKEGGGDKTPLDILNTSYKALGPRVRGSATACVAKLEASGMLRVANLGDSGVMVIRPTESHSLEVVFKSKEQQHRFNHPYQLGTNSDDTPKDADLYKFQLLVGDIVIMGSDGLFDNMFDSAIVSTVGCCILEEPSVISRVVAKEAFSVSHNRYVETPWSRSFSDANDTDAFGGKKDDISVLVARVTLRGVGGSRVPSVHSVVANGFTTSSAESSNTYSYSGAF